MSMRRNAFNSMLLAGSRHAGTLFFLLAACQAPAQAADASEEGESPWSLGISVGHGRQANPFIESDDIDIHLVLDLAWYGEKFFFDNGDFGYALWQRPTFSVNAIATFDNERNYFSYLRNPASGLGALSSLGGESLNPPGVGRTGEPGEPDAGAVAGPAEDNAAITSAGSGRGGLFFADADSALPKRRFALNGGLEFLYLGALGDLQAQILTDLGGTHGGQSASLVYSKPWYTAKQEYALSLGMEWKSRDLVGYYYGVRPDEAFFGRPGYEGEAGVNTFLRFAASHSFDRHWKLVGVLEREFLSGGIRRSPIIDRDSVDTFYLGLLYQF